MPPQTPPTFYEFATFLRKETGNKNTFPITPATLFENDLGVTGDDGDDLLMAVEKHYGISLEPLRETFAMQPNEYLFHSEGFSPIDFIELIRVTKNLFSSTKEPRPFVRPFRVEELFDAVCRLMQSQRSNHSSQIDKPS
ncbi:hypothetical protein [Fibrella aquatilis]|uniref:Uncharacterized protein n=1 Tax=Fibrella aquatilis TaxID=2817059 RepID=A0A939JXC9_9BACT|nr:hypothetical protein [Fibrella aquatilis]MBO0932812.1 hypothetical protein [Fibrella aquatilis]